MSDEDTAGARNNRQKSHPWHFLGQSLHLLARLRDHIERLDGGKAYAVDDLAVVLRGFLHPGRGNRVLAQLLELSHLQQRTLQVSKAPQTTPGTHLSIGSIPSSYADPNALGGRELTFSEWTVEPVAHVQIGATTQTWSWSALVNEYSNKWGGSHLDERVSVPLSLLDTYSVGGLSLTAFLLRSAAAAIWGVANDAFLVLFGTEMPKAAANEVVRVGAEGALTEDPRDVSSAGKLDWLAWTDELDYLWIVSETEPAHLGLNINYPVDLNWHGLTSGSEGAEAKIVRPRQPTGSGLTKESFSLGRAIRLVGRMALRELVLSDDPEKAAAPWVTDGSMTVKANPLA